jgi:hypothetical protein
MTGQIPKYGEHFRRESTPYEPDRDVATRRYVLKTDPRFFIQSTRDSEHWTVYIAGPEGAAFPIAEPDDTLTEAMLRAVAVYDAIKANL